MEINPTEKVWQKSECAVFCRSKDKYGQLSNMTFGYPLKVNGINFQGPEGLYQALKFPNHTDIQYEIAKQRSGMDAKKVAYRFSKEFVLNWDDIKMDAMAFTLSIKLLQHPIRFGNALYETENKPIVELSRRDGYWGAMPVKDNALVGRNVLGCLLTMLRDYCSEHNYYKAAGAMLEQTNLKDLYVANNLIVKQ